MGETARKLGRIAAVTMLAFGVSFMGQSAAHASVPSSQLEFWDLRGDVYSIFIHGPNQVPVPTVYCLKTPNKVTILQNWWWSSTTYVDLYKGSDCTTGHIGYVYFNSDGASWRCLEDTPPYRDYDC
jgi:hypothetical protein